MEEGKGGGGKLGIFRHDLDPKGQQIKNTQKQLHNLKNFDLEKN